MAPGRPVDELPARLLFPREEDRERQQFERFPVLAIVRFLECFNVAIDPRQTSDVWERDEIAREIVSRMLCSHRRKSESPLEKDLLSNVYGLAHEEKFEELVRILHNMKTEDFEEICKEQAIPRDSFDRYETDGRQTFRIPSHVLDALVSTFLKFLANDGTTLDEAFGGKTRQQLQQILRVRRDNEIVWDVLRERERASSERRSMGHGTPHEIACERVAEKWHMSPDNVRKVYKKSR